MNPNNRTAINVDWLTIAVYVALVILGWINIYAAVYNEEHKSIFDFQMRYGNQMLWITFAFLIGTIILLIDTKFYTFFAYILYGLSLLLLLLVLVIGKEINGAKAWINIGPFGLQPAEFSKVACALAIAKYMSGYNVKINSLKTLMVVCVILFIPIVLIALQPDAGSILVFLSFSLVLYREGLPGSVLIFGVLLAALFFISLLVSKLAIVVGIISLGFLIYMLFSKNYKETVIGLLAFGVIAALTWGVSSIAGKKLELYYILAAAFIVSGIGFLVVTIFFRRIKHVTTFVPIIIGSILFTSSVDYVFNKLLEPHQQRRMHILLGIESDPLGMGYNVNQSMIAIGSGGFAGKGFLQGTQTKYNFVPEQTTDFIFCTVGEEWGFLGTGVVIGLFVLLIIRVLILAERQRSLFSRIYGYSVASILFFHFTINIGMTIGLLPVIGIPLPFFSYGGSSLWAFTILLFILIRFDASRFELLR
ncbi:MAG TPA: rod shape-determining protein RodA [Bacteroidales bacterium]|nr:rod shape-determining protein RodA [Bacteroidales bacterium]